jgi:hypothetical protein
MNLKTLLCLIYSIPKLSYFYTCDTCSKHMSHVSQILLSCVINHQMCHRRPFRKNELKQVWVWAGEGVKKWFQGPTIYTRVNKTKIFCLTLIVYSISSKRKKTAKNMCCACVIPALYPSFLPPEWRLLRPSIMRLNQLLMIDTQTTSSATKEMEDRVRGI